MSRNGSGTYSLPVGNPVVTGTTISSTWANNTLTDIANALTGSLAADGQTTASGNLNMGTNRIINLSDPTSSQDAVTKYYVDQLISALGTMAYQDADDVLITGGAISNVNLDLHLKTNEIYLPVGPTALRTASPIQGLMRFNTDGPFYEGYVAGNWHRFLTVNEGAYTITYFAVGGGAGGGPVSTTTPGGGGAGGAVASTTSVIPGTSILTMIIGGGGATATAGSASTITGIASAGGGGAGSQNGGSAGNGYAGGAGFSVPGGNTCGGGGGGAAANGDSAGGSNGGNGGSGALTLITGTSQYFGGGGGGGAGPGGVTSGGSGGAGGGGNGASAATPSSGLTNTGGGGGGSWTIAGANGGSGIIYISMPTLNYTGTTTGSPAISTTGSSTVLRYTSSGTYTC